MRHRNVLEIGIVRSRGGPKLLSQWWWSLATQTRARGSTYTVRWTIHLRRHCRTLYWCSMCQFPTTSNRNCAACTPGVQGSTIDKLYIMIMDQAFDKLGDRGCILRKEVLTSVILFQTPLSMTSLAILLNMSSGQTKADCHRFIR